VKKQIYLDPVEIPGFAQIAGAMIEDAATWAECTLQASEGAAAMQWVPALEVYTCLRIVVHLG
jgi:hypothetical protein